MGLTPKGAKWGRFHLPWPFGAVKCFGDHSKWSVSLEGHPKNPSPGWFQPSSLWSWWDLEFVQQDQSELPAPGNNSSSSTPSIAAPAQPIALCVSSQCTAAHVHTQKNTNGDKLPSRQSLRTSKLLKNQSTFQGGKAVNQKGKNAQRGF